MYLISDSGVDADHVLRAVMKPQTRQFSPSCSTPLIAHVFLARTGRPTLKGTSLTPGDAHL